MEKISNENEKRKCSFVVPKEWQKLVLYLFMIFMTGCTYWGWNGIQELLYKAGSFEELCDGELETTTMEIGGKHYIDCGPRKSGINNLYTVAYSAHFITSVFTGMLVDSIGPKICYAAGQFINFMLWVLIGLMPKNPWVLRISFFLIGVTAESLYMPLMSVSYNFPDKRSFIISLMGSSRSLSFFIPSVMSAIYQLDIFEPKKLYIVSSGYGILGNLVCMIIGLVIVDKKFDNSIEEKISSDVINADDSPSSVYNTLEGQRKSLTIIQKGKKLLKRVIKNPQLFEYLGVVLCASLFLTSIGFVNKSHREMLLTSEGKSAATIFKYLNILTFIPAPILGKVIDRFGAGLVLMILHSCCFMYYFCASFDIYGLKILACVFYFVAVSLCISSTYCYINQRFPRKNFGMLVGFSFLIAGSVNLTNIPLYDLASKKLEYLAPFNFRPVSYILMGYMVVCIITSSSLYMFSRKKITMPKEEPKIIKV